MSKKQKNIANVANSVTTPVFESHYLSDLPTWLPKFPTWQVVPSGSARAFEDLDWAWTSFDIPKQLLIVANYEQELVFANSKYELRHSHDVEKLASKYSLHKILYPSFIGMACYLDIGDGQSEPKLFDLFDIDRQSFLTPGEVRKYANKLGLNTVEFKMPDTFPKGEVIVPLTEAIHGARVVLIE